MCLNYEQRTSTLGGFMHHLPRMSFSLRSVKHAFQPGNPEYWESVFIFISLPVISMLIITFSCTALCCHITFENKVKALRKISHCMCPAMIIAMLSCIGVYVFVINNDSDLHHTIEGFRLAEEHFYLTTSLGRRGIALAENYSCSLISGLEKIAALEDSIKIHNMIESVQKSVDNLNVSMEELTLSPETANQLIEAVSARSSHTIAALTTSIFLASCLFWLYIFMKYRSNIQVLNFLIIFSIFVLIFSLIFYSYIYVLLGMLAADFCNNSCKGVLALFRVLPNSNLEVIKYYLYRKEAVYNPIQYTAGSKKNASKALERVFWKMNPVVEEAESLRIIRDSKKMIESYQYRVEDIQAILDDGTIPQSVLEMVNYICLDFLSWVIKMLIATSLTWFLLHIVLIGISHFLVSLRIKHGSFSRD